MHDPLLSIFSSSNAKCECVCFFPKSAPTRKPKAIRITRWCNISNGFDLRRFCRAIHTECISSQQQQQRRTKTHIHIHVLHFRIAFSPKSTRITWFLRHIHINTHTQTPSLCRTQHSRIFTSLNRCTRIVPHMMGAAYHVCTFNKCTICVRPEYPNVSKRVCVCVAQQECECAAYSCDISTLLHSRATAS